MSLHFILQFHIYEGQSHNLSSSILALITVLLCHYYSFTCTSCRKCGIYRMVEWAFYSLLAEVHVLGYQPMCHNCLSTGNR